MGTDDQEASVSKSLLGSSEDVLPQQQGSVPIIWAIPFASKKRPAFQGKPM